jgi:hypothetical protein
VGKKVTDFNRQDKKKCRVASGVFKKSKRLEKKLEFVREAGGKCANCGYSKNLAALVFHHNDPKDKEFTLSGHALLSRSNFELLKELKKCTLLCQNCHMEHHHPDLANLI